MERESKDKDMILNIWLKYPFYGYRKIYENLKQAKIEIGMKRVRRLMTKMKLKAIFPKPGFSKANKEHEKYPYLLKDKIIRYPNQVWAADITYIKLDNKHYVYLVVILDLYSRKVLSWKLSNMLDKQFCIDALEDAIMTFGVPAIFNTDQGCQFTSKAFINILKEHGIEISMNGRGRALDNIYVERFFRSIKYEEVYLYTYSDISELKISIANYVTFYNSIRPHQGLYNQRPDQMYESFVDENRVVKAA